MKQIKLAIIGAGIAGVSASIYAQRAGLEFVLFEPKAIGGQLLLMQNVDNYVGVTLGTQGSELAQTLSSNLSDLDIQPVQEEIVSMQVNAEDKTVVLETAQQKYCAQAVIIATGASFRKLGIPKEEVLTGKGVSYCAICDGFFFRKKVVAVVGGGNTAVEEALYLADICEKVYLIHRRDSLRAIQYLQDKLNKKANVEVLYNTVVVEAKGDQVLESLVLADTQDHSQRTLAVSGLFIAIGVSPVTTLCSKIVTCDEAGFIITDQEMKTSVDFIWACGDCRQRPLRQLITAAGEGAIASISVYKYLKGHYISA